MAYSIHSHTTTGNEDLKRQRLTITRTVPHLLIKVIGSMDDVMKEPLYDVHQRDRKRRAKGSSGA